MPAPNQGSVKKQLIDKANTRIVVFAGSASFIVIFCLVAAYILAGQMSYQHRVINAKQTALDQLNSDLTNTKQLMSAYKTFVSQPNNIIGGSSTGNSGRNGDNAKIVLDALPSSYDFPALTSSIEKILVANGGTIQSMTGEDDQAEQSDAPSSNPQPVEMPFDFTVQGNYMAVQKTVDALGRSIRPIQIQTMEITGGEDKMILDIQAQSYYQPAKSLKITKQVVQ